MDNSVIITYPADKADQVKVHYSIEQTNDLQTISCSVEGAFYPRWLQLRKFSIVSLMERGSYTTLYNEINNSKNMDTALFIDLVYSSIMQQESCQYS